MAVALPWPQAWSGNGRGLGPYPWAIGLRQGAEQQKSSCHLAVAGAFLLCRSWKHGPARDVLTWAILAGS